MLGIEFMKQPTSVGLNAIRGFEYMDFQEPTVYKGLVGILEKVVKTDPHGDVFLEWTDELTESFEDFIKDGTGICVKMQDGDEVGNAAIEAGYFSPNNLVNNAGIDQWFDAKHTNVAVAMKTLRTDVLNGWVDTSTGKVGGDFSKIEFRLWVQSYVESYIKTGKLKKFNVTPSEALSAVILHELGHAFSAFLMAFQTTLDAVFPLQAVRMAMNAPSGNQRAQIVKDSLKQMECAEKVDPKDAHLLETAEGITLFFDKAIENRNLRRSLSLGVSSRSAESYADIYAVRMGAGKALVAGLASMSNGLPLGLVMFLALYTFAVGGLIMGAGAAMVIGGSYAIMLSLLHLGLILVPGDGYDSPYRRLRAILREMIAKIPGTTFLSAADKKKAINQCKDMAKQIEEEKNLLEGTAFQRLLGWIGSGSDFRAQDFEHYTQELMAHEITLYKDYFKD